MVWSRIPTPSEYRDMFEEILRDPDRAYKVKMLKRLLDRIQLHYNSSNGSLPSDDVLILIRDIERELFKQENILSLEQEAYDETPIVEQNEPPPRFPHFGLSDSEPMKLHWADTYHRLVRMGYLDARSVSSKEWVYVCCGAKSSPQQPIVWLGNKAALAYMIRTYLNGKWKLALRTFVLPNQQPLKPNLKTTHPPAAKTKSEIDEAFSKELTDY